MICFRVSIVFTVLFLVYSNAIKSNSRTRLGINYNTNLRNQPQRGPGPSPEVRLQPQDLERVQTDVQNEALKGFNRGAENAARKLLGGKEEYTRGTLKVSMQADPRLEMNIRIENDPPRLRLGRVKGEGNIKVKVSSSLRKNHLFADKRRVVFDWNCVNNEKVCNNACYRIRCKHGDARKGIWRVATEEETKENRRSSGQRYSGAERPCVPDRFQRNPVDTSVDEFPWAKTREGGAGASLRCVPPGQNSAGGGHLVDFLRKEKMAPGDGFYLIIPPDVQQAPYCVEENLACDNDGGQFIFNQAGGRGRRPAGQRPFSLNRRSHIHKRSLIEKRVTPGTSKQGARRRVKYATSLRRFKASDGHDRLWLTTSGEGTLEGAIAYDHTGRKTKIKEEVSQSGSEAKLEKNPLAGKGHLPNEATATVTGEHGMRVYRNRKNDKEKLFVPRTSIKNMIGKMAYNEGGQGFKIVKEVRGHKAYDKSATVQLDDGRLLEFQVTANKAIQLGDIVVSDHGSKEIWKAIFPDGSSPNPSGQQPTFKPEPVAKRRKLRGTQ